MMQLLDVAKERGVTINRSFYYWESYYDDWFTPTKALEEELKKRNIKSTQNKFTTFFARSASDT